MMDLFPIEGGGGDRRPSAPGECKRCLGPTVTTRGRLIEGAVYCEACAKKNAEDCGYLRTMNSAPLHDPGGRPKDISLEIAILTAIEKLGSGTVSDIVRETERPLTTVYCNCQDYLRKKYILPIAEKRRYKKYTLTAQGKQVMEELVSTAQSGDYAG